MNSLDFHKRRLLMQHQSVLFWMSQKHNDFRVIYLAQNFNQEKNPMRRTFVSPQVWHTEKVLSTEYLSDGLLRI